MSDRKNDSDGVRRTSKKFIGYLIALLLITAGLLHATRPKWLSFDRSSLVLVLLGILLLFVQPNDIGIYLGQLKTKQSVGYVIAFLLIMGGLLHGTRPKWFSLDWPSLVLILVGILLLFVPLHDIGLYLESLEFGKTKLTFRKLANLDNEVDRAAIEAETTAVTSKTTLSQPVRGDSIPTQDEIDRRIELLLSADKDMALIRIGIEIERVLAELERGLGGASSGPAIVWSRTMRNLQQNRVITPQTCTALTEFRNVRNQIIHSSGGKVPEPLIASAIDSGIKLLQLLMNIRRNPG